MNTQKKHTRRSVLNILFYISVLCFSRPARVLDKFFALISPVRPLASTLTQFIVDKESARRIGLEYLRCVPREADAKLLVDTICSYNAVHHADFTDATAGEMRELLSHQQRWDFEHGRVINVRGWILSETEVRLCALIAVA